MNDSFKPKYLGQTSFINQGHDPSILDAIPRQQVSCKSMQGFDLWRCFEVSALYLDAKPFRELVFFYVPLSSEFIVESKSLKLYLNAFNTCRFHCADDLLRLIAKDLSNCLGCVIVCQRQENANWATSFADDFICLDDQKDFQQYDQPDIKQLKSNGLKQSNQQVYTRLFRSLCPVTHQPDWATIVLSYRGAQLCLSSLFSYLLAFRQHNGFHELCVSRIFNDLFHSAKFDFLAVYACFMRRGGIAICPYRATAFNDAQLVMDANI
eukprot:COSAG01_NODE_4_length_55812_cov_1344.168109_36_plen_266_part_00